MLKVQRKIGFIGVLKSVFQSERMCFENKMFFYCRSWLRFSQRVLSVFMSVISVANFYPCKIILAIV